MSGPDLNFMPAVRCPHCGAINRPAISGWGGELSTRHKVCRLCGKEYALIVYATTSIDIGNTISRVNSIKERIRHLRRRIKEKRENLDNKLADWSEEFLRVEASTRGKQN